MEQISENNNEKQSAAWREEILSLKARAHSMGANDYELSNLDSIIKQIGKGEITSDEGLKKARNIVESKQSYH